ncbi:MAG: hypothetical protein V8R79_00150 [Candidatus Gastranaerophilaceae bacterium]
MKITKYINQVLTHKGTFTYKGEEKEVTLIVQNSTLPVIQGIKDIEVLSL